MKQLGALTNGLLWIAFLAMAFGCGDESQEVALKLDLVTDVIPQREFVALRISIDGKEHQTLPYLESSYQKRVAELSLKPAATRVVDFELLNQAATVVASRKARFVHDSDRLVRMTISRGCLGVTCDENLTCVGEKCVDPLCVFGDEPECNKTCSVSTCQPKTSCSTAECIFGACVEVPNDLMCATNETCQPIAGCVANMVDAGVIDAGAADADTMDSTLDADGVDAQDAEVDGSSEPEACGANCSCVEPTCRKVCESGSCQMGCLANGCELECSEGASCRLSCAIGGSSSSCSVGDGPTETLTCRNGRCVRK